MCITLHWRRRRVLFTSEQRFAICAVFVFYVKSSKKGEKSKKRTYRWRFWSESSRRWRWGVSWTTCATIRNGCGRNAGGEALYIERGQRCNVCTRTKLLIDFRPNTRASCACRPLLAFLCETQRNSWYFQGKKKIFCKKNLTAKVAQDRITKERCSSPE